MRTDLPNQLKSELLTEFSGHSAIIGGANAVNSEGGDEMQAAYEAFCGRVSLTEEWLRSVAESQYIQHFSHQMLTPCVHEWLEHHRLTENAVRAPTPS